MEKKMDVNKIKRVEIFKDTMERIENNAELAALTKIAVAKTVLYGEDCVLPNADSVSDSVTAIIKVENKRTFEAARELDEKYNKVAVLNFASGTNPGGGVVKGSNAQEECLCRTSNLFPCLNQPNLLDGYYGYHKRQGGWIYSDRIIYTPRVTVFKTDEKLPEYTEDWFQVGVISATAPNLRNLDKLSVKFSKIALKATIKSRIEKVLDVAIANGAEALVLGAWGCGAFKWPPLLVANAFDEVLSEKRYAHHFKEIVFAVLVIRDTDRENFDTFTKVLVK